MEKTGSIQCVPLSRRVRYLWDVLVTLVDRELKLSYKRSSLGVLWALGNPIMQLIVFTVIFQKVIRVNIVNYASYVFIGLLAWNWFSSSLSHSTTLITGSRALVRQPGFPLALLPLVSVGVRFFHLIIALPVLLCLLLMQNIRPTAVWAMLPILLAVQFVLNTALAYPLAALNVRLRDTSHVVAVLLQLMMYMTPIFYDASSLPKRIRVWYDLNPMVPLVEAWRDVLMFGTMPNLKSLTVIAVLGLGLLWAGRYLFIVESHRFVEEL